METISFGPGRMGQVVFADPGSREDDLGGGTIYAALVKSSTLRALGRLLGPGETVTHGETAVDLTEGAAGAVIADSSTYANVPIQFVAPEAFVAALKTRLGGTLAGCTVGDFLSAVIAQAAVTPIAAWETFAAWLENGSSGGNSYRSLINQCFDESSGIAFTPISGSGQAGSLSPMPEIHSIGDLFGWLLACMPAALRNAGVSVITSPTVATKLGFTAVVSPLASGASWIGSSVTLRVWFRL